MCIPTVAVLVAAVAACAGDPGQQASRQSSCELSVKFKEGVGLHAPGPTEAGRFGSPRLGRICERYGCRGLRRLHSSRPAGDRRPSAHGLGRAYTLTVGDCSRLDSLVHTLKTTGLFEYVERAASATADATAAYTPDDPYLSRQWYLINDGESGKEDADIDADEAWEVEQGDSSIIVAILDTGCKLSHRDFAGRLWHNPGEIPDNGEDDDGNGYVDDIHGWDFVNDDNDPSDDHYHGTGMAGFVGANGDNGYGLAGMDWRCKLMIVKVLNSSAGGSDREVAQGMVYAADNGARVISSSISLSRSTSRMLDALGYAYEKRLIICSTTGNRGESEISFPASDSRTIAVGATDRSDCWVERWGNRDGGSNHGDGIDLVAPGDGVQALHPSLDPSQVWRHFGTSPANALVAGTVALLVAQDPARGPEDIRSILRETADDQVGDPDIDTPGWDRYHGAGRLNASGALSLGQQTADARRPLHAAPQEKRRGAVAFSPHVRRMELHASLPILVDCRGRRFNYHRVWTARTANHAVAIIRYPRLSE